MPENIPPALLAERFNGGGFRSPGPIPHRTPAESFDGELNVARRRRDLREAIDPDGATREAQLRWSDHA